jgi:hypothetical protein
MFRFQVCAEGGFEFLNFGGLDFVEVSLNTCEENASLFFNSHWHVLLLLQEFSQLLSTVKELLGDCIKIGSELGEGCDLTILGEFELEGTSDLFHGLDLSSSSDTGHG